MTASPEVANGRAEGRSGSHYPDLTASRAATLSDLLVDAERDMGTILQQSRSYPIAASPAAGTEPDAALTILAAAPPARPTARADATVSAMPDTVAGRPPHELGVGELLAAFASGALTPSALLDDLEPRWASSGPAPAAVLNLVPGTRSAATESDSRWRTSTARPLEGIPFAVKDIIDSAGAVVTCGSLTTGDRVAEADATVVARLRAVGAIPVFMAATTEFACGAPENARYGAVPNPWDATRWAGGSSTGSGAALAARLVPLALGTDTGGSIRVPSAVCNLTGIKPTYGLIPRTGVASLSWTLDHVGPMARSAADLALVLPHLVGPDGVDPTAMPDDSARAAVTTTPNDLRSVRLGIADGWFTDRCDAAVIAAFDAARAALDGAGATTVPVGVGDVHRIHDDVTVILTCELASNQEAALDRFALFDIGTQIRIARGTVPSAVDYLRSVRRRADSQREALRLWDDAGVDFMLTPGIGATAARLSDVTVEIDGRRHPMQALVGRNTSVFDYLGFPAVMMPAGFADGLPVGVQLVGRPGTDALCLDVAQRFQQLTAHHRRHPPAGSGVR